LRRWEDSAEVKDKTVREFTTEDAEHYLRRQGFRSSSTWNKPVCYLHAFYEQYEDRRRRKRPQEPPIANPMKGLRKSEKDSERDRQLMVEEEKVLMGVLPTVADRVIVLLAIHAPLRRGNIFALDWDRHVNLQARTIQGWTRKGRTKRLR